MRLKITNSLFAFVDQGVYSGTNFLLTLFLANQLSIVDFGSYSSIVLGTYLVLSMMSALLIQPFQVNVAKAANPYDYCAIIFIGLLLFFIVLFLVGLGFLFFAKTLAFPILPALFFACAYLFQDFIRRVFLAIDKVAIVLGIDLFFLGLISVVFSRYSSITLTQALTIVAWANSISCIYALFVIVIHFKSLKGWKNVFNEHKKQGKWLFSVALLQWGASNFFVMVSGIYLGIEALGALRLVQSIYGVLNIFLQAIENYFLPKVASVYHVNSSKAKQMVHQMTGYGALLFGTVLLLLCIYAQELIEIAGGVKYASYAFLIRFMAVLYFIIFLSYPFRIMIRVHVLNQTFFYGYVWSFGLSLISFHFLLEFYGLWGALLGLMFNQLVMIFYWNFSLRKQRHLLWK